MNLRIIRAIVMKDLVDVLKNKSLVTLLVVPLFIAALYLVFSIAIQTPARVLAYNPDGVPLSDTLKLGPPRLSVDNAANADAVRSSIDDKNSPYDYGIVVPAGTIADLKAGKRPALELLINGQKVRDYIDQERARESFFGYFQAQAGPPPYQPISQVFNLSSTGASSSLELARQNQAFFAIIALAIVPISVGIYILPSLIVEEKEKKTIRLLLTSPARSIDVVIAKSMVSFFYTMVLSLLILLVYIGNVADIPTLFLFIVLGNLFACALGILFGAYFNDIQTVHVWLSIAGLLLMLPIFFVVPYLANIPGLSQALYLIPSYYMAKGMLGAGIGDLTFDSGLLYAGLLAAFTIVAFLVAAWTLRRRTIFA